MKKSSLFIALLLQGASLSFALDLTPKTYEVPTSNGMSRTRFYFVDGDGKYTVNTNVHTKVSGQRGETVFSFERLQGATLLIKISPHQPDLEFGDQELETYRKTAASFTPAGAVRKGDQEEVSNAFFIEGRSSHGFVSSYTIPGSTIRQSVTFLNLTPKQQIILVTTAFATEFEAAQKQSAQIIDSWHKISDTDLNGPLIN